MGYLPLLQTETQRIAHLKVNVGFLVYVSDLQPKETILIFTPEDIWICHYSNSVETLGLISIGSSSVDNGFFFPLMACSSGQLFYILRSLTLIVSNLVKYCDKTR